MPGTLQVVLAYLTVYIVWGSTYFFISRALHGFPPFMLGSHPVYHRRSAYDGLGDLEKRKPVGSGVHQAGSHQRIFSLICRQWCGNIC